MASAGASSEGAGVGGDADRQGDRGGGDLESECAGRPNWGGEVDDGVTGAVVVDVEPVSEDDEEDDDEDEEDSKETAAQLVRQFAKQICKDASLEISISHFLTSDSNPAGKSRQCAIRGSSGTPRLVSSL